MKIFTILKKKEKDFQEIENILGDDKEVLQVIDNVIKGSIDELRPFIKDKEVKDIFSEKIFGIFEEKFSDFFELLENREGMIGDDIGQVVKFSITRLVNFNHTVLGNGKITEKKIIEFFFNFLKINETLEVDKRGVILSNLADFGSSLGNKQQKIIFRYFEFSI